MQSCEVLLLGARGLGPLAFSGPGGPGAALGAAAFLFTARNLKRPAFGGLRPPKANSATGGLRPPAPCFAIEEVAHA